MRRLVLLVIVFLMVSPVMGQGCGHGVPCKPVTWPLPKFPTLVSPTPFTVPAATPSGTVTPPTNTPAPTNTHTPTYTHTPTNTLTYTPSLTRTPFPTWTPTRTPTITYTPSASPTPINYGPTNTPFFDHASIAHEAETLEGLFESTPIISSSGTPITFENQIAPIATNVTDFVGYAKGITELSLGPAAPLANLLILGISLIIFLKVMTFLLPVLVAMYKMIVQVVGMVMRAVRGGA